MDVRPAEPASQPHVPPPARVSRWVRVRPFVAAFILVGVSLVSLHIWDQIGPLSEDPVTGSLPPRPPVAEVRQVASPTSRPAATASLNPNSVPALPTAAPVLAALPTGAITPIVPEVVQPKTMDLVITIVEPTVEPTSPPPTARPQPTARLPQQPRPVVPTAIPRLPSRPVVVPVVPTPRPVVTRPPVVVAPPPRVSPAPTAWRVPVQTPSNWTRPRALATPAP